MNKKNNKALKIASVALASVVASGLMAGCSLITADNDKDMAQVIAEVDISRGAQFQTGGEYAAYADVIDSTKVLKRDLVNSFLSYGYQNVQNGMSYKDAVNSIKNSLVNREMLLQYALVALLQEDGYSVEGYNAAKNASNLTTERDKEIAGIRYFLNAEELGRATYTLKKSFNDAIDAQEQSLIDAKEEETHSHETRTLPTGADTANEDYYDPNYQIYTGRNAVSACGSYEALEGSTVATRKLAYSNTIANLVENKLISKGENVENFEELNYYKDQMLLVYQDSLMTKLVEVFEKNAEATVTKEYAEGKYNEMLADQQEAYTDITAYESALDAVSDTSFVLTAPKSGYGFAINILIPFSDAQNDMYKAYSADHTDGENFVYRASLLQNVTGTDQRGAWINGETDYSYTVGEGDATQYLFFEEGFKGDDSQYQQIKNYAGTYAYNGKVVKSEGEEHRYDLTPNKVNIDEFISIMEGQLNKTLGDGKAMGVKVGGDNYYAKDASEYYVGNTTEVDYSEFVYYVGKADLGTADANATFDPTSAANKAMSVINELSFAYNTDTSGLNSYLGYAVSAYKTGFVSEYEYAAKLAIEGGVGTYTVAPSTYGWHIIYCTFVYDQNAVENGVYTFDWTQKDVEGTFSNLYYEALKSTTVSDQSTRMQTRVTNDFATCVTVYEHTYQDIVDLDKQ